MRGGSDQLKRALVTRGLEEAVNRVREHLDAGATTVVLQVLGEHVPMRREPTGRGWPTLSCDSNAAEAHVVVPEENDATRELGVVAVLEQPARELFADRAASAGGT